MKHILLTFTILLIFSSSAAFASADAGGLYVPGRVYVKFRAGAPETGKWLSSGRTRVPDAITRILGVSKSAPFIRDGLLKLVEKREMQSGRTFLTGERQSLGRIAVIEYGKNLKPEVAAGLIGGIGFIEYAEPVPVARLSFTPNDSLFKDEWFIRKIKADSAWDALSVSDTLLVGIVDTGVDYNHEDLAPLIWQNPGETGTDSLGNDKRSNGIDDDNNGFIDDWRGWDFVSSTDTVRHEDNDPAPGSSHGTHVAGITGAMINNGKGIAGVAKNVKFLPVKIGYDNPLSGSVTNSYEGLLYAAATGAKVINCSWGSSSRSAAEQEVVKEALAFGAFIAAAAGNDGQKIPYYPASYDGVLSVAATDSTDYKANFSNWHSSVGIAAPGVAIMSCIPFNDYRTMDGTSMATPVVTGVAAMVRLKHPEYNAIQVAGHLKATADNIDTLNPVYTGYIGSGRVNALNAVTRQNAKATVIEKYTLRDENGDGLFEPGELAELSFKVLNVLSPVRNVYLKAIPPKFVSPVFTADSVFVGDMLTMESVAPEGKIVFRVAYDSPVDYVVTLGIRSMDSAGVISTDYINFTVNPSYRTFTGNNITLTANSAGNIAFNDYPFNLQGDGFKYKNGSNLLYEGAFMVSTGEGFFSDCARGAAQSFKDMDFSTLDLINRKVSEAPFSETGTTRFTDFYGEYADSIAAKVDVRFNLWQFNDEGRQDFVILAYDVVNRTGLFRDSVFAGMFMDWDIGPSGANNKITFDESRRLGIIKNVEKDTLPVVAVSMISSRDLNFYAIDNDATSANNPGVWDGFPKYEKYFMLSGGVARKETDVTDVSLVIGAGPMRMNPLDTVRVAFAIAAGRTAEEAAASIDKAKKAADEFGLTDGNYLKIPKTSKITSIYPNPVVTTATCLLDMASEDNITLEIIDLTGKIVSEPAAGHFVHIGLNHVEINCGDLASGVYFVRMTDSGGNTFDEPIIVAR